MVQQTSINVHKHILFCRFRELGVSHAFNICVFDGLSKFRNVGHSWNSKLLKCGNLVERFFLCQIHPSIIVVVSIDALVIIITKKSIITLG